MEKAVELFTAWAREKLKALPGATLEVVRLARPHAADLDRSARAKRRRHHPDVWPSRQAAGDERLGRRHRALEPVLKDERLYGRGGADDGYAMFAALAALLALKEQNIAHARAVIVIEACEESGSPDLPFYIEHLAARIGTPDLVVCLDSGCGNYEQLWLTTILRGKVIGNLTVRVLTEGVHSGDASGIVPSSFRIARQLLSRIEDEASGADETAMPCSCRFRRSGMEQAKAAAEILGDEVWTELPFAGGTQPMAATIVELILNRTWRPQLAVTGDGRLSRCRKMAAMCFCLITTLKLSLRLPPTCDGRTGAAGGEKSAGRKSALWRRSAVRRAARRNGWNAPALAPWLAKALDKASNAAFGKPAAFHGRRRLDSLHGDAGREISQDPIRGDRRAGAAFQRPWPQRIPAHPHRQESLRVHRLHPGGSRAQHDELSRFRR